AALGVRILSTGGTAELLRRHSIDVTDVSAWTGTAEILDGRVKTLHPRVHGGLLARATEAHRQEMAAHGLEPIDLLVVNLYPFATTIAHPECTLAEALEQIDIGGPAMLRAAGKNHERVAVLTDPADYAPLLAELRIHGGTSLATRRQLARKAFQLTAAYDAVIAAFLERVPDEASEKERVARLPAAPLPAVLTLGLQRKQMLRYGENPQQAAALYVAPWPTRCSLAAAEVLQGKELSYNNLLDLDAALGLVLDLHGPAAVIVKHTNACGAAIDQGGVLAAFRAARVSDPVSAFGGIVAVNRQVGEELARELTDMFLECVIAPDYSDAARTVLGARPNLRVLRYRERPDPVEGELSIRSIAGGVLVQTPDGAVDEALAARCVSRRPASDEERRVLDFAWRVCKHIKSNAIVLCRGSAVGALVVGVGAGQMSRVDAVRLAVERAGDRAVGAVLASDAFFPFRDGVDVAARAGVTAIIQPGGSVRDAEVIAAADEHSLAMLLTGVRHFRH
ncbi:MAG: bifunctional phosphoribosylaminoimidazolecarboxamide formyltransferase/IMP cyclohydrolase, partial [Myxococcales bacterium]|nr:bifunctional phosphoribosylaminoimidazolecarboxamide formyltransferase/IMP cyclohydrolase [Myxococcales bacterium]